MTDDDRVFSTELHWKLSQIRKCVPERLVPHVPHKFDSESLLMLDLAETEHVRDEWARIAESYRTIAEVAIEALARSEQTNAKMRAFLKNVTDELTFRKPQ